MLSNDKIEALAKTLDRGGLVLLPTDTIWGIACDATDAAAVARAAALAQRPPSAPMVVLVDGSAMLLRHARRIHPRILTLVELHQRPLTVLYEQAQGLAPALLDAEGRAAIRIVQDDLCRRIIARLQRPIVATAAHVAGRAFPRNFGEISSDIISGVDMVAPYRQAEKDWHQPSVLVRFHPVLEELEFLRE